MSLKEALYSTVNGTKLGRAVLETRRVLRGDDAARAIAASTYEFDNRGTGSDRLCFVLAGYKPALWDDVFGRLAAYVPADVDVCILTSGLVSAQLRSLAEKNGWSYLATSVNHIGYVQNLVIELFPCAQWLYKLDEDIFLTRGYFERLLDTYRNIEESSPYLPAFVSPLINVNCYGSLRILERVGLIDNFREMGLAETKLTDGVHHNLAMVREPEVARYLWGDTQPALSDIDALSARFASDGAGYSICPVRYSIGAILFTRVSWEEFEHFPLTCIGDAHGLGDDEEHICRYACFSGRVMAIDEEIVVGHLGYGGAQTKAMLSYHEEHPERFSLKQSGR